MSDPKSRCLEAALRPLENEAETKIAAIGAIRDLIDASDDRELEEAVRRWEAADGKRRWPVRYILGLLVVISFWILAKDYQEVSWYVTLTNHARGSAMFAPLPTAPAYLLDSVPADKKLLFALDPSDSIEDRFRELWQSAPDNPAYFSAYAVAYIKAHNALPDGFHETVKRIDPENAWFKYMEAGLLGKNSIKEQATGKTPKAVPGSIPVTAWEVTNQTNLDRSLELISQATALPKCNSYSAEILREQIDAFHQGSLGDLCGFTNAISRMDISQFTVLPPVTNVISARAGQLVGSNDLAGFERLSDDAASYLRATSRIPPDTAINGLANTLGARMVAQLASSSGKLNATDINQRWQASNDAFEESLKRRKAYKFLWEGGTEEDFKRAAGLGFSSMSMIARLAPDHPPSVSILDLEPTRWAEHDLLSRLLSYPLWLVLALFLTATIIYQKISSSLSRMLGERATALLGPSDWAWILITGVILPFVYVAAINRLTPLGGRDFGLTGNSALMPAAHLVGLLALWLVVPAAMVRWRLSVRGKVLGMRRPSVTQWAIIACATAFVPAVGWATLSRKMPEFWSELMTWNSLEEAFAPGFPFEFWVATALLAIPVLWMLWSASSGIFGISTNHIQRAATARILTVVSTGMLVLIALSAIALKQSEHRWFAKDTLLRANPDFPGWTPHEYKVAVQMRAELKKNLGFTD